MVFEISIYLLITLICGIALIVMAMFGFEDIGGFDFDGGMDFDTGGLDGGDISATGMSPLSLPLMLSFGTAFGAFGTIFSSMELNPYLVPVLAGAISLGISGVVFFLLVKVFIKTQANTQVRTKRLVGKTAVVTIPIKPGEVGQIRIKTPQRGRTLLSATAKEEIAIDTMIIIEDVVGSTAVVSKKKGLVE
jgi:membrane protein implicated in regulation of membrane protease activity